MAKNEKPEKRELTALLEKQKRKLYLEAGLRALCFGGACALFALFCMSLGFHIAVAETPVAAAIAEFFLVFIAAGLLSFLFFRPDERKIAARVDGVGLSDRVGTALEFMDDAGEAAAAQRKDTVRVLSEGKAQPRFRVCVREIVVCTVCALLAVTMLILPYNLFALNSNSEADREKERQEQIAKDLIDKLRDEIDKNKENNESDLEKKLNDVVNDLEKKLSRGSDAEEKAAHMSAAQKKIDKLFEEREAAEGLGEALQRSDITREFGEAIEKGDREKARAAADKLKEEIGNNGEKKKELTDALKEAVEDAGKEGDDLTDALKELEEDLNGAQNGEEEAEAFEKAKEAIDKALERSNARKAEKEELDKLLADAKKEMLEPSEGDQPQPGEQGQPQPGEEGGDQPQPGEGEGEPQPGEGEGEQEDPNGQGEGDKGSDGSGRFEGDRSEPIYDSFSGKVAYGEVYDVYYAAYLEAQMRGEVSEELKAIMDEYFKYIG